MNRFLFFAFTFVVTLLLGVTSGVGQTRAQQSATSERAVSAFGSGLAICSAPITPVVPENPTVVTDCTQAGLQSALDMGGEITFACGVAPITIGLTTPLQVTAQRTVIDGGGLITLDGQGQTKILENGFIAGATP